MTIEGLSLENIDNKLNDTGNNVQTISKTDYLNIIRIFLIFNKQYLFVEIRNRISRFAGTFETYGWFFVASSVVCNYTKFIGRSCKKYRR